VSHNVFLFGFWELALVVPTALVVVLKWLVTYSYRNLVWHHLKFCYYKNVATNLVDVVKFVASFLYLEGKMFGFKGVAFVVFQMIMRLHMCDFWHLIYFCFVTLALTFVF